MVAAFLPSLSVTPSAAAPTAQNLTCPTAVTLKELIICISGQMPVSNSEDFDVPTAAVVNDWQTVVTQMLGGACDGIILPPTLSGVYTVSTFSDTDNGQDYCVAMEVLDGDDDNVVDRGWGTFIINNSPLRNLSIDIVHPLHDSNTDDQGIALFKQLDARTFLMAGAHRHANSVVSSCQSSFEQADVAHNVDNLFFATVELIDGRYQTHGWAYTALQFHGMGVSSCPGVDVYLTHGMNDAPLASETIVSLRSNLAAAQPTWVVNVPGDTPGCTLHGTTNVEGRLLNGVTAASVCTVAASSRSGRFIHIEQKFSHRSPAEWIGPLMATFPVDVTAVTLQQTQIIAQEEAPLALLAFILIAGLMTWRLVRRQSR
ncbi:MAG: hypothetical protein GY796_07020 [Chloroflexi bacterium]|nr:hypothetical protein [Chloroflexota bacterium]